jgi:hypothetical protein
MEREAYKNVHHFIACTDAYTNPMPDQMGFENVIMTKNIHTATFWREGSCTEGRGCCTHSQLGMHGDRGEAEVTDSDS